MSIQCGTCRTQAISNNPTNSICCQDHKQQTVTHTSYANCGTHPAWQWFILPRARATARRRRITATCLNMLQHASTDDTEGHAWPMSSCISLKGQALPAHTFSPTSQFNCHNSIGFRPRGVRISSWPSCASHLSVQTPATKIQHQAETVGAEVHLRHAGSPTYRQAQESRPALTPAWNVWDAHVRLSQKISVWEHTWPVYLTIRFNMTKYPYVKIRDDRRLKYYTIPYAIRILDPILYILWSKGTTYIF